MMRALEAATSGATAKIRVAAPGSDGGAEHDSDKFSAVPSQLSGLGTRKTLVGIVPPAKPAAAAGSRKTESMVIAGAPCKSIDVSSDEDGELPPSIAALRRPGSPTVPFPRPRAAARAMPWELEPDAGDVPGRDTIPQSWRERTGHTLRVVLSDPDHRPHLIAGIVVCAAAALVIFAAGRSPVAGTGALGQATRSLEPPAPGIPAPAPAGTPDRLQRPSPDSTLAQPSANAAAPAPEEAKPSRLQGQEVAPGLVIPRTPPAESDERPRTESRPKSSPSAAPPSAPPAPTLHPAPAAAPGDARPAPPGHAATAGAELHAPVAPRAAPKKPGTEPGAPPRATNGDFDFGI
jgi:hypothetical protein